MFAKSVTESDEFLELSKNAQCSYYHLCMYADDDGFINNVKSVLRIVGSTKEDLEELKRTNYIHEFDSGIILVMHWKAHNYIQKDRYKPTVYVDEKNKVEIIYGSAYVLK
jgi:hypothetical protein